MKLKHALLGLGFVGALGIGVALAQGISLLPSLQNDDTFDVLRAGSPLNNGVSAEVLRDFVNAAPEGQAVLPSSLITQEAVATTSGTNTDCVATTTYVAEIFVPSTMELTGVAILNGTAVAGNVQLGLADSTGAPIAAALTASTAASGTTAFQRIPFAAPYVAEGPATYYIQYQCNNTGHDLRTITFGNMATTSQTSGTYGTFVALTPPTTFTTAVGPIVGLY